MFPGKLTELYQEDSTVKTKNRIACFILTLCIILTLASTAFAVFDDSALTWDGKPDTLSRVAGILNYDMVDDDGDYKPLYHYFAKELWSKGLMLGSDGTFNLDKPLTRVEGIIMTLRLLGKEQEALEQKLPCPFTDVPDWAKYQVAFAAKNGITSGYSATIFGAGDEMTANQYLTFVLRAMGYDDKNGDFIWSSAADKALEIKLIGEPCREQYMRSNLFLRDNVAVISYVALFIVESKDGTMLGDGIIAQKPAGDAPSAMAANKPATEGKPADEKPTEEKPPVTGVDYEKFSVPQYESADASAARVTVKEADDRLFLAYSGSGYRTVEYKALLRASGFFSEGSISFEAEIVRSVSGGITSTGTKAWVCDWYSSGNLHVVFGQVGDAFIVRIYQGEVDTFSSNGLRSFYAIMKS